MRGDQGPCMREKQRQQRKVAVATVTQLTARERAQPQYEGGQAVPKVFLFRSLTRSSSSYPMHSFSHQ